MTYLEAITLVKENEGKEFDYSAYCTDTWDIQMLVEYLHRLEKSDSNDYPFVVDDIIVHLDSCGFSKDEYKEVINALGLASHIQILSAR